MGIKFDGSLKTIFISADQKWVDVQRELYMRSVDWLRDNTMFIPPFESEGGGYLIDQSPAPMIFRFKDKWKLVYEVPTEPKVQILRFRNGLLALQSVDDLERVVMLSNQYFQNIIYCDHKFDEIASHRQLVKDIGPFLEKSHKNGMFLGAMYLDIDNFKALNTELTETKVDVDVLPKIIKILRNAIEDHGFLYREGGDEFVCLIPLFNVDQLRSLAENLRKSVEVNRIEGHRITISIGIATSRSLADTELLHRANEAKAIAKSKGRNRVEESA